MMRTIRSFNHSIDPKSRMGPGEPIFGFNIVPQVALYPRMEAQFWDDSTVHWCLSGALASVRPEDQKHSMNRQKAS